MAPPVGTAVSRTRSQRGHCSTVDGGVNGRRRAGEGAPSSTPDGASARLVCLRWGRGGTGSATVGARPGWARQKRSTGMTSQRQHQTEQTIVDNEVYNLLTATANKLEGLAAYNKYERDGGDSAQRSEERRVGKE